MQNFYSRSWGIGKDVQNAESNPKAYIGTSRGEIRP